MKIKLIQIENIVKILAIITKKLIYIKMNSSPAFIRLRNRKVEKKKQLKKVNGQNTSKIQITSTNTVSSTATSLTISSNNIAITSEPIESLTTNLQSSKLNDDLVMTTETTANTQSNEDNEDFVYIMNI